MEKFKALIITNQVYIIIALTAFTAFIGWKVLKK